MLSEPVSKLGGMGRRRSEPIRIPAMSTVCFLAESPCRARTASGPNKTFWALQSSHTVSRNCRSLELPQGAQTGGCVTSIVPSSSMRCRVSLSHLTFPIVRLNSTKKSLMSLEVV
jgi:hypothetical protein